MDIAIQGGQASFHHMAALEHVGCDSVELLACKTFRQVCEHVTEGRAQLAVMAVENSLAGGLLPNYSLLMEYPLQIIAEVWLHIGQNLMTLPGQSMEDIKIVRSHPVALLQCNRFLRQYPNLVLEETWDTAESARELAEQQTPGVAVVAGGLAARTYGMDVLARNIENDPKNYTRFLILAKNRPALLTGRGKASINFKLGHRPGTLAETLNIFHRHALNLTQIQSLPVQGRPQEYAFHVDVAFLDPAALHAALGQLNHLAHDLKLLGIYKKGEKVYDHPSSIPA